MATLRVALVQLESRDDVAANLEHAAALAREAANGADLVVLPEYLQHRGNAAGYRASAAPIPGPTTAPLQAVARETGAWILAGTHAEATTDPRRPYNTAVVLAPDGSVAARYRKLHLFDIAVIDGPADTESARVMPGEEAVVVEAAGALLGLTICYDLRFPALYRALALAGAEVMTIPAAFTRPTGEAHWEVLMRARAIETGSFVLAPAQGGFHEDGRGTWGRSIAVAPWGEVLARLDHDEPGVLFADLDLAASAKARRAIPALINARSFAGP